MMDVQLSLPWQFWKNRLKELEDDAFTSPHWSACFHFSSSSDWSEVDSYSHFPLLLLLSWKGWNNRDVCNIYLDLLLLEEWNLEQITRYLKCPILFSWSLYPPNPGKCLALSCCSKYLFSEYVNVQIPLCQCGQRRREGRQLIVLSQPRIRSNCCRIFNR